METTFSFDPPSLSLSLSLPLEHGTRIIDNSEGAYSHLSALSNALRLASVGSW